MFRMTVPAELRDIARDILWKMVPGGVATGAAVLDVCPSACLILWRKIRGEVRMQVGVGLASFALASSCLSMTALGLRKLNIVYQFGFRMVGMSFIMPLVASTMAHLYVGMMFKLELVSWENGPAAASARSATKIARKVSERRIVSVEVVVFVLCLLFVF